ncbi:hypothetical protein DVJ77_12175 [Dyella tabacisoli]|uniref:Uncharacterized protein n=2 Tax=Dyella tabacisoli TaxID=2282381 RepID=A0A369UMY6_9GAMM|nr:hypothetical protein DVJ77_12175 [Dyella tabacisoli]
MVRITAVTSCLLAFAITVYAADAPKGWLMVRDGAANTNANYANEDSDINGRLTGVSVLCKNIADTPVTVNALIATDATRVWGAARNVGGVTTVVNLGGKVVIDPQTNNPNHCVINGLTLSQIKGIWH